jgi:hypothetical protein
MRGQVHHNGIETAMIDEAADADDSDDEVMVNCCIRLFNASFPFASPNQQTPSSLDCTCSISPAYNGRACNNSCLRHHDALRP